MFKELESDNLEEALGAKPQVVVQYGAGWCGNCRMIKPKFKRLADEHGDIDFIYVDAEKFPNSRSHAEVSNLPTFAGFKEGKLVKQAQGNKIDIVKEIVDALTSH